MTINDPRFGKDPGLARTTRYEFAKRLRQENFR